MPHASTQDSASPPPVIRLLGPCEVTGPLGTAGLVGTRQRVLVALLALDAGKALTQSRLIDTLWGDDPPRTAVRTLQSHIARVRQALDACGLPEILVTRGPGYALHLDRDHVDAHRFESLVREARADLPGQQWSAAAQRLDEALALWRGEALSGLGDDGWATAERERLHALRLAAAEDLWELRLRLGDHVSAVGELERLVAEHPVRERLIGLLMLGLYRSGRQADALGHYQRAAARLADELGLDPGEQLQELHRSMLRRDRSLDLPKPPSTAPAQLPAATGHFCGRDAELAGLRGWVPGASIAVVSGPAGVGKSALAVQWAHEARELFPDGQLFLDLLGHDPDAALTAAEALTHVLRGLGVPPDRVPAEPSEQSAQVRTLLQDRRVLLVLDNAGTADHVLPLVPATPGSALLVTSRQQLSALVVQHAVHAVELDVMDPAGARELLGRILGAARVDAEPEAATRLAELCGLLPLALRIAAAKLAARPRQRIDDLVAQLSGDDRLGVLSVAGDSHGIRGVLATAYQALSEPAARLFRLLGLHPGATFVPHLAAGVAGVSHGRVRRSIDELAAAHLITEIDSDRYRFHDLIRLYARERALADETPQARAEAADRLLDWYRAVSAATNTALSPTRTRIVPAIVHQPEALPFKAESAAAVGFLDRERGNLVPVVAHAVELGRFTVACELAYLLAGFFGRRGSGTDRIAICRLGVTAADRLGDAAYAGLMRSALGVALNAGRRYAEALDVLAEALPLAIAGGDRRDEGHVHNNMAIAHAGLRRFDEAAVAFGRALELHSRNDPAAVAVALNNVGYAEVQAGRSPVDRLSTALALAREVGNLPLEAAVQHGLGLACRNGGDHEAALRWLRDSVDTYRRIGDLREVPGGLADIGATLLVTGDHGGALAHFGEALELSRAHADRHVESVVLGQVGRTHLETGDLAAAREHLTAALDLRRRVPDPYEEAHLHRWLGVLAEQRDDAAAVAAHRDRAAELYAAANARAEAAALAR
ncbi:DNA-binding SARP family transcriptional activator/Flp pilus assembly protein TadD [Allocatelliglobosispora scoriae]|uniref:DNA-binding SARP family transcriptional activator/Flp pilus assembly protein TadD n=1 Tax=Allocatelliglobosispora scoriae TaxID=643052 RepID=A0A841C3D1_9ACTN|nr:BTAD domain-containing putative transcriptional regulator [Allocatelliglobosispora scoriae]MBB5873460.1 DNA-binding SARP family transcriptional activator/Flp pilus assembly protein TadD [Allocatelliglobosispora scoriae]